ncbi:zinc dependent phospholipase C family protein [Eubacteriaceae bacterium ES2]|nr:zinc dependent phospholipase C family protein [Eubacteriaceae bacterium ES2]
MIKKDHKALSRYFMEHMNYPVEYKLKKAVVLGSIEPDYNPVTYLRGSIKKQRFRGHNYENTRECITKLVRKIQYKNMSERKKCYLLGKLLHYIADAFTFPHNSGFSGSLLDHCAYEKKLHEYMKTIINQNSFEWNQSGLEENMLKQLDDLHLEYRNESYGFITDCRYIFSAVAMAFGYLTEMKNQNIVFEEEIVF